MISSLHKRNGMFRLNWPAEVPPPTGERLASTENKEVLIEHLHRYCLARDFCGDREVLDVASGTGYGAAILAGVARQVHGLEVDSQAVDFARRSYSASNLIFEMGDALKMPFEAASFDVVVSFETLEHLTDHVCFMREVKRVLRPGGLLIISTPDRQVHSGLRMPVNPHHISELSAGEFEALLGEHFESHVLLAQRTLAGSIVASNTLSEGFPRSYEQRDSITIEATDGLARAVYLLALASDGSLPAVPASIFAGAESLGGLYSQLTYGQHALAEAQKALAAVEAERLVNQMERDALRQELDRAHSEREIYGAKVETLQQTIASSEAALQLTRVDLDRRNSERDVCAAEILGLQQALATSEGALLLTQMERDTLRQDLSRSNSERDTCAAEIEELQQALDLAKQEINRTRDELAQAALVGEELNEARKVAAYFQSEHARLSAELLALRSAAGVRIGLYSMRLASNLPEPVASSLRRTVKRALRSRDHRRGLGASTPVESSNVEPGSVAGTRQRMRVNGVNRLVATRFPALQPISAFPVADSSRRLTIVTDSVGPSSLFGGVGTAILLGATLANRLEAKLRIITRTEPPSAAAAQRVLASNGVDLKGALEVAYAPHNSSGDIPVSSNDLFLTTSWWTTRAVLGSVAPERVVALVQEDERMFYPFGDDRLRCAETLAESGIVTVVNSRLLFDHLAGDEQLVNIARDNLWFEPAFPGERPRQQRGAKRRLFFYARPHNQRNLFWRGLQALDAAVAEGIFNPADWELYFVGRDVPIVELARGLVPVVSAPMEWGEYHSFIASMDAGFTLMDTPHPSYPPFDLAAAGAAVLTNTHPGKSSLSHFSENILVSPLGVDDLVEGLGRLARLAEDDRTREANRAADHIQRDWNAALASVSHRLLNRLGLN